MTRNDVLNGNEDLIAHAAGILADLPARVLSATVGRADGGETSVSATTRNISWLDVYVDGRPRLTLDVEYGTTAFQLPPGPPVPHTLELRGFDGGELVAATRVGL